jgi:hypothetical protein
MPPRTVDVRGGSIVVSKNSMKLRDAKARKAKSIHTTLEQHKRVKKELVPPVNCYRVRSSSHIEPTIACPKCYGHASVVLYCRNHLLNCSLEGKNVAKQLRPTPTAEQFKTALLALRRTIHEKQRDMLEAHFRAPDYEITATKLAEAVHWPRYEAVNLHYGDLGKQIGEYLGLAAPMTRDDGTPVWTSILALDIGEADESGHYVWRLRPELVAALTELPWGFTKPKRTPKHNCR